MKIIIRKIIVNRLMRPGSWILIFIVLLGSCKKFVEIQPPVNQIVTKTVFSNDATAESAISGIYSEMINSEKMVSGGANSITCLAGLSSDELIGYPVFGSYLPFYNNNLATNNNTVLSDIWEPAYKFIFYANSILEGLQQSSGVSDSAKKQLEGEAKFVRAFCHFYLINLFGDIPIVTTTDYRTNNTTIRNKIYDVYQQVIKDLTEAKQLLPIDYIRFQGERVRPTAGAATALLSRVYLYNQDWVMAEDAASELISNSPLYILEPDLTKVFLKNSSEAIWQLKPINKNYTNEGAVFILSSSISLNGEIISSMEAGDRRLSWIDSNEVENAVRFYPHKYRDNNSSSLLNEYSMIFRLGEQYLIRAEARARLSDFYGAAEDLNSIRSRADLNDTDADTENLLIDAIEKERKIELFAEWGHRWFDLKRLGRADVVLHAIKNQSWQLTDTIYPIPQTEIKNNPRLIQNAGYN